ncbi:MAG: ribosomal protein L7/L12 [Pseudoxanthomonas sp.]
MKRVLITGWVIGFNKIETNKVLRSHLGYSLREAKDAVDAILLGTVIEFDLPGDQALQICAQLEKLNATCRIE